MLDHGNDLGRHEPAGPNGGPATGDFGDLDHPPDGRHLHSPSGFRRGDVETLHARSDVDENLDPVAFHCNQGTATLLGAEWPGLPWPVGRAPGGPMDREDWDLKYAGDELLWRAEPNRFLVEATADLDAGSVLDVACGEGRNAMWLAERGWRATGVDFSPVALEKARRLAAARGVDVEWVEADVRSWHPDRSFDLVAIFYLHLPSDQRRSVYRTFAGVVAPGGHLLVVGHDAENLTAGVGGPQDPDVLYSAQDLIASIEGSGLVVERAEQLRRPVETDDGTVDALDALVRAVRPVA